MNIKKIALVSGGTVLAIAAVFAAKPRTTISTVFYTISNSCTGHSFGVTGTHFTTNGSSANQATIKTSGGTVSKKLFAVCTLGVPTKPVHFIP